MSDEQSGLPVSVTFTSLGGEDLPASVQAFIIEEAPEGGDSFRMSFTMAFDVFERALASEAFNLFPHVFTGGGVPAFEAASPVVIEARLRAPAAAGFAKRASISGVLPEQLLGDALLLRAESWLALRLEQSLELPPEIGDGAHASIVCDTAWSQPVAAKSARPLMAAVATEALTALGYQVDAIDQNLLRTLVNRNGHSWVMLVHLDEEQRTCVCWSVYPQAASAEQRDAVARYLMEGNYELSVGSFEMDPQDGEIRFRTSIDVGDGALESGLFARLVARNFEGMGRAFPMLSAYFS